MRNAVIKAVASLLLVTTLICSLNIHPAYAADLEIQGSGTKSQAVEVVANISSVYAVTMPASITLSYGVLEDVYVDGVLHNSAEGYWGTIVYGCAGKISDVEEVFIEPVFPCTMTGLSSGATISLQKVLPSTRVEPQSVWDSSNIGTCDFNGIAITNCSYSYCSGLRVGFLSRDIPSFETYKGNLLFNFGIRAK